MPSMFFFSFIFFDYIVYLLAFLPSYFAVFDYIMCYPKYVVVFAVMSSTPTSYNNVTTGDVAKRIKILLKLVTVTMKFQVRGGCMLPLGRL